MYRLYQSLLGLNCCLWRVGYRIVGAADKWADSAPRKKPATFDYSFLFALMSVEQMSVVYK